MQIAKELDWPVKRGSSSPTRNRLLRPVLCKSLTNLTGYKSTHPVGTTRLLCRPFANAAYVLRRAVVAGRPRLTATLWPESVGLREYPLKFGPQLKSFSRKQLPHRSEPSANTTNPIPHPIDAFKSCQISSTLSIMPSAGSSWTLGAHHQRSNATSLLIEGTGAISNQFTSKARPAIL